MHLLKQDLPSLYRIHLRGSSFNSRIEQTHPCGLDSLLNPLSNVPILFPTAGKDQPMLWKKDKSQTPSAAPEEAPLLSPFEAVFNDVLDYYSSTLQQLFQLEKWDYKIPFHNVLKARFGGDAQKSLTQLRNGFQEVRSKEISQGRRYLSDLRGMLWQSIDQVFYMLDAHKKDGAPITKAKQDLQKALKQSNLEAARQIMKEVLANLAVLDQERQTTVQALQNSFQKQLELLQSELQTVQKELQLDGLTQINNRSSFDQQIKKTAQLSYLTGQQSCLIMLDIDHFKKVNDSYGHPAGDSVIQYFARVLAQAFPRKTDVVARYGGEEFAVILQGADLTESNDLVQKLLNKVRSQRIPHNEQEIGITCSAGIALYQAGEMVEQWLARADKALYEAKQKGRDRCILAENTFT